MKDAGQGVSEVADYASALARVREMRGVPSSYPTKDASFRRQLRKRITTARAKLTLPFLQAGEATRSDAREYSRLCALICSGWCVLLLALLLAHLDTMSQFPIQPPNQKQHQLPVTFKVLPDHIAYDHAYQSVSEYQRVLWQPIELHPANQGTAPTSTNYFMRLQDGKGYCQFENLLNPKQVATVIVRLKGNQIICDVHENK